jgi:hypothetical protein
MSIDIVHDHDFQDITIGELHEKRLKSFKKYIINNIKEEKLKSILIQFSSMPTYVFFTKIRDIVLPQSANLNSFLKQLCDESDIDISKFDPKVIDKVIRFLSFFCQVCNEFFS